MYINNSSHYYVTMARSLEFSMNVFSFFKKNERIDIARTQEKLESSWIWKCGGVRVTTPRSRDFKECQLSQKKSYSISTLTKTVIYPELSFLMIFSIFQNSRIILNILWFENTHTNNWNVEVKQYTRVTSCWFVN